MRQPARSALTTFVFATCLCVQWCFASSLFERGPFAFADESLQRSETQPAYGTAGSAKRNASDQAPEQTSELASDKASERANELASSSGLNLRRSPNGVQLQYPNVAKIVGRSPSKLREDGAQSVSFYYGTGVYVSEFREWGIVFTNWHVISEAEESIEVVFPSGSYPARAILHDETWDLSALLIKRPRDLLPNPISLEAPRLGEQLWVGGYGQSGGLNNFQMQTGRLTSYVSLVDPDETTLDDGEADQADREHKVVPLYETLSIGCGVRQGDSGGPIFNRYGELSGLLWGSDGKSTMGTICLRLHSFLTQATYAAARLYASNQLDAEETGVPAEEHMLFKGSPSDCPKAKHTDLSMIDALRLDRCSPISTSDVYVSASSSALTAQALMNMQTLDQAETATRNSVDSDAETPPSPAVFSPTFVKQQRKNRLARPERISRERLDALTNSALEHVRAEREQKGLWASNPRATTTIVDPTSALRLELDPAATSKDGSAWLEPVAQANDAPTASNADSAPSGAEATDASLDDALLGESQLEAPSETQVVESNGESNANDPSEQGADADPAASNGTLSDLQTYIVVCMVLFVFFFAARLILVGDENAERKKRKKLRLREEK